MAKIKTRSMMSESNNQPPQDWVIYDSPGRSTPYTEEELDLLVESTAENIRDTSVWNNLVLKVGKEKALQILRTRLIMRDEKAVTETRH